MFSFPSTSALTTHTVDVSHALSMIERRLQFWDAQIRLLEVRMEHHVDPPARERDVRLLRRQWQSLRGTLDALRDASTDAWSNVERGIDRRFADLDQTLERIRAVAG